MNSSSNNHSVRIASPMQRLIALVYDFLLVAALVLVTHLFLVVVGTLIFGVSQKAQTLPAWYLQGLVFSADVFVVFSFYAVFWKKAGQTLGMQTWHLKTVLGNGQYLSYAQGYFRCLMACVVPVLCAVVGYMSYHQPKAAIISFVVGFLCNYIFAYTNAKRLAIHDLLSGSMTLKMPSPKLQLFKKKK